MRRLVFQNLLKCMGTLQIFIDPLLSLIGIFYLKLRSIYRTVYMQADLGLCER
jgi:hypothetical protein